MRKFINTAAANTILGPVKEYVVVFLLPCVSNGGASSICAVFFSKAGKTQPNNQSAWRFPSVEK